MFTLRVVNDNSQINYVLGIQYSVISRFEQQEEFESEFLKSFGFPHVADLDDLANEHTKKCYAFIVTKEYDSIPLYMNQKNFIMTDTGKTFDRIKF